MSILKPRTASVIIYQGDDMNRLTELRRAANVAERLADEARQSAEDAKGTPRRGGDPVAEPDPEALEAERAAKAGYDNFVDEAAERAVEVVLHSIGRKRFRDLMLEHSPRKVTRKDDEGKEEEVDHPDDADWDVNVETFPLALLTFIDAEDSEVRTIGAPGFSTRKAVQDFLDNEIAEGDFAGMWTAAYFLNRQPSADPKGSRYSVASQSSTAT